MLIGFLVVFACLACLAFVALTVRTHLFLRQVVKHQRATLQSLAGDLDTARVTADELVSERNALRSERNMLRSEIVNLNRSHIVVPSKEMK